jgi:putative redox protein
MKTVVKWSGKDSENSFQFVGSTQEGHHTILSARNGAAQKTASSPKEVVAMGQAACTGIDVVSTLQKMREPLSDLLISCDVSITTEYPQVFERCEMIYEVSGQGLNDSKVAHAVEMSLLKYCGVSTMIERSGCEIVPRLFINGNGVSIWDPDSKRAMALSVWVTTVALKCPRGIALVVGGSRGIGRALVNRLSDM